MRIKLFTYFSVVTGIAIPILIFMQFKAPCCEKVSFEENGQNIEQVMYRSDLSESCPNATSVVVSVLAGGRLGNQVWEYLSVWAVARNHPGWWPAVPRTILNSLQPLFSPLAIPAIEDLAERCNAPFWIEELKNCASDGNQNLLQAALDDKERTRPFLLVLPKYIIHVNTTVAHWSELRFQLPFTLTLQKSREEKLHEINIKIRHALKMKDDDALEFVGVHVRRTDFSRYIEHKYSDAKAAGQQFYLKAMKEMRRQLHPRHCAFVVVSDDLAWCREFLTGAPDVEIAGTGDTKNPYFDLALLSACNHSVFAYGTYGLTAAMQHPHGKTILHAQGGSKNAVVLIAKLLNWTLV